MLTPANTFILGLVANGPVNPYDIVSRFKYNRYSTILQIPDSTIYSNIRSMANKGYMDYELQRDGNMPAKKVYSLTDMGRTCFEETVKEYLSDYHTEWSGFSIALLMMHHFEKKELLECLNKRKTVLKKLLSDRENECYFVDSMQKIEPCIPNITSALHVAIRIREELYVTMTTISLLEKAKSWPQSTFVSQVIYDKYYEDWDKEKKKVLAYNY